MESTENIGDSEMTASKGTNGPSVVLPHQGVLTPQNASQRIRRCPECGSDCLDICVDSKGEVFLLCMSCINLFPENG